MKNVKNLKRKIELREHSFAAKGWSPPQFESTDFDEDKFFVSARIQIYMEKVT